mmetsp:Transcript_20782/g.37009  ORF Transcript_20782/g.37009 Transcript_20782/m.37009 type:complete len:220 (-) Transcript_20782:381-1040(-)
MLDRAAHSNYTSYMDLNIPKSPVPLSFSIPAAIHSPSLDSETPASLCPNEFVHIRAFSSESWWFTSHNLTQPDSPAVKITSPSVRTQERASPVLMSRKQSPFVTSNILTLPSLLTVVTSYPVFERAIPVTSRLCAFIVLWRVPVLRSQSITTPSWDAEHASRDVASIHTHIIGCSWSYKSSNGRGSNLDCLSCHSFTQPSHEPESTLPSLSATDETASS